MMRPRTLLCLVTSAAIAFAGVGAQESAKKVNVLTTLNILKHICERIGGDRVSVKALADPRQDPHSIQAKPTMQEAAADADLFIEIGRGLDIWADNVVQNSGNTRIQTGGNRLVASEGCSTEELPNILSREGGDIHAQGNPHVWLDPLNVKIIARNIAAALSRFERRYEDEFKGNLKAFEKEIDTAMFGETLVREVGADFLWRKASLGKLADWLEQKGLKEKAGGWFRKSASLRGVKFISYHKTYIYFAVRFGFDIAGELEEKPGIPPPPRHRDEVVQLVKDQSVKIILNDTFYPTQAAEYVAERTGAKVLVVPIEVGVVEGASTYVRLIDYLLDSMIGALK